ncbi:MAG: hypothetical protein HY060_23720 [Proteobacteria bacterium]|nr:hypothetical protein [Pseudomonadota bacterium]
MEAERLSAGGVPSPNAVRGCGVLALGVALAVASAAHAADRCDSLPPARVTVQALYPEPAIDTSLDLAGLAARARQRDGQHGELERPLGLTVAKLIGGFEVAIDFAMVDARGPLICGAIKDVTARVGFEDAVIYVAREIVGDRCAYDEVHQHERRHIQVDREVLAQFTPRIEAALRALVASRGVARGRSTDAVAHELRERLRLVVDGELRSLAQEMRKRQRVVDRPDEYRRLGRVCGGVLARPWAAGRRAGP